jgi:D-alanine-D-alanine ligase
MTEGWRRARPGLGKNHLPEARQAAYLAPMQNSNKRRILVLCGGLSGEHEVSLVSGTSVYQALDKAKYEVQMVGIDKKGRWVAVPDSQIPKDIVKARELDLSKNLDTVTLLPYASEKPLVWLKQPKAEAVDVILPILHGTNAEDGTIQGLLELSQIPFVGSSVLGSAAGMDKDITKRLCQAVGVPVVPWRVIKKSDQAPRIESLIQELASEFNYPYFVKPANMGSSVGVSKVKSASEARSKIEQAWEYDTKVMVEKFIPARELEVSVLGNDKPKTSVIGEVLPQHEFYSYEAKYLDENGARLNIPAKDLSPEQIGKIQNYAIQTFQALECLGLARVDFFIDKQTQQIYLNEINTMPGFTNISMYPKMWAAAGLAYPDLLDQLIDLAVARSVERKNLKTTFN